MSNEITTSRVSMNSKEIAELTGKKHSHVLRDIREMLSALSHDPDLDHAESQGVLVHRDSRQYVTLVELDKDHTLTLVTGYDTLSRFRVIKRWQKLETEFAEQVEKEVERRSAQKILGEDWWKIRRRAATHYNKLMDEVEAVFDRHESVDPETRKTKLNCLRASEANFLNQIILGMTASDFRWWFHQFSGPIRDSFPEKLLNAFENAEALDGALLRDGQRRPARKRIIEAMLNTHFPEVLAYRDMVQAECARIETEEPDIDVSDRYSKSPKHPAKYKELGPDREFLEMLNVREVVLVSMNEETEERREDSLDNGLYEIDIVL